MKIEAKKKLRLSACVIVKNEAENLPRWLRCMAQVADEMIVVDTGSQDNTVALAEAAGAKVFHFQWINDFAAAKNYALEQANGDWILFLDADEYFSEESLQVLRQEMQRYHRDKKAGVVLCRLINIDKENNNKIVDTMLQSRIFRNLPNIRFEGCVHERLINTKGNLKMLSNSKLVIYHTGYSASNFQKKAKRNMVLLQERLKQAKTQKEQDSLAHFMMDVYHSLGDYENAIKYARRAIDNGTQLVGMEGYLYEILFSASQSAGRSRAELFAILEEAMSAYPEEASFVIEKGYLLWQAGDFAQAEACMLQALDLRREFEHKVAGGMMLTDNALRILPEIYHVLGDIALKSGDKKLAADYFFHGLQVYKYHNALLRGLYSCIGDNEPADIILLLNSLYNRQEDGRFIYKALKGCGHKKLLLYYARADDAVSSVEKFLLVGRYDGAAVAAAENIRNAARQLACHAIRRQLSPNDVTEIKDSERELSILDEKTWQNNRAMLEFILPATYKKLASSSVPDRFGMVGRSVSRILEGTGIRTYDNVYVADSQYPLVSIMIPTYNRPQLFEKTLQSALAQTYPNVEILVTDNSTNEETRLLMEKYVEDGRVKYFRNREAGCKADNFRPFEKMAKGEYLQWCMDDDILHRDKLWVMAQALRDNPDVALVSSQRTFIDMDGNLLSDDGGRIITDDAQWRCYKGVEVGRFLLSNVSNFIGEPSAVLFRRQDLQHHYWGADCRGYKTISDVAMWLELLSKGDFLLFREPLSYYRRHAGQEGQQPEVVLLSRMEWSRLMDEYMAQEIYLDEAAYLQGKMALWQDYQQLQAMPVLQQAGNFAEYQACMESIGNLLGRKQE
ncbi:glycosyltransferase [Anaerovibrio sp.]|uniref:glycosyltransferase n=1 Tax=Anaerovibrio sp. TaxID=1872532 RepID=UPI0026116576|nr:glycosyltransferase [Anaerovibrio sp.]MDD6598121.1 glycosyltransferase [Anaerovibrio sp.]